MRHDVLTEEWLEEAKKKMGKGGVGNHATATHVPAAKATSVPNRRGSDPASKNREPGTNPAPSPLFFLIPGQPMGKPRMTQRDKWKKRPVVVRYREWCDSARKAVGCTEKTTLIFPVQIGLRIFLACPASWSRKKQLAHNGEPHTGKPDVDNVVKGVMDALFTNDSFVFKVVAEKYWTENNPHIAVTIEEVKVSAKHLQDKAHHFTHDTTAWWYEQTDGICVVQEFLTDQGVLFGVRVNTIPWRAIRSALKRKDSHE